MVEETIHHTHKDFHYSMKRDKISNQSKEDQLVKLEGIPQKVRTAIHEPIVATLV